MIDCESFNFNVLDTVIHNGNNNNANRSLCFPEIKFKNLKIIYKKKIYREDKMRTLLNAYYPQESVFHGV